MADKYIKYLESLPFDIIHIAESFAKDNKSPQIEPAHLLRSLLHKSAGLVKFIEDALNEDYYYLVDWADIRMQQCDRSPYGMKGVILSPESKQVVKEAIDISERYGLPSLTSECLLASLLTPGIGFTFEQLKTVTLTADKIIAYISERKPSPKNPADISLSQPNTLYNNVENEYCHVISFPTDSNEIIGFNDEIIIMSEVLARKDRANLLIIGDTGVGKTSLIHRFVKEIENKTLATSLSSLQPFELDLVALSQGVTYKGEVEDRFKTVINNLQNTVQPLLVIENFHRVEDKQSVLYGILPNMKKVIQTGKVQFLLTTTIDGYTKDIEKDKELTAYFEKLNVEEPSESQSVEILRSKQNSYENFHHLKIEEDVASEIVRLAKRYLPERRLPSSAIDLLDRTMASTKIKIEMAAEKDEAQFANLKKEDVRNSVSKITGIPMGDIQSEERDKLTNAEEILHKRVVGQNHAIKSILDAIYESRSGLNKKGQPIGSFFFLGPTGTGKTELAKSLAEFLFNDETAILRFDMSEYKEEHSVALLYGAPPGYVGYEEGGLLVNQIRRHPYSVVLFDEIEKAHRSVFDLFLQILDEGKLHDRLGRMGDFSNALIIFTSNIGSDYIFKSFGENKVPTHDQMLEVMQGQFRPEFLARLTEIVPFSPITTEMINRIFDIHIKNLLKTLKEQNITLDIDETARNYVTSVGFNAHYGARPILGIIRKEIRRPLSKMIISGDINSGDTVCMKYNDEKKEVIWEISDDSEMAQ